MSARKLSSFSEDEQFQIAETAILNEKEDEEIMSENDIEDAKVFFAILRSQGVNTCCACSNHVEQFELSKDGQCRRCDPRGHWIGGEE